MESSVLHSAFESDTVLVKDDALKVVADVLVYHLLMDNVPVSIFLVDARYQDDQFWVTFNISGSVTS